MQIKVVLPGTSEWDHAVRLVRYKYRRNFAAEVDPNPDAFLTCLVQEAGEYVPVACAGLTHSDNRRLFSEQYLPEPIEVMISRSENRPVARSAVIEVGSLAATRVWAGSELVRVTPLLSWCMGKEFIMLTATQQLRALLLKAGIPFHPLCYAEDTVLDADSRARWGNYYEQAPQTGYVSLAQTMPGFAQRTGRYRFDDIVINLVQQQQREEADYAVA